MLTSCSNFHTIPVIKFGPAGGRLHKESTADIENEPAANGGEFDPKEYE
jgi:hypothetical protein